MTAGRIPAKTYYTDLRKKCKRFFYFPESPIRHAPCPEHKKENHQTLMVPFSVLFNLFVEPVKDPALDNIDIMDVVASDCDIISHNAGVILFLVPGGKELDTPFQRTGADGGRTYADSASDIGHN